MADSFIVLPILFVIDLGATYNARFIRFVPFACFFCPRTGWTAFGRSFRPAPCFASVPFAWFRKKKQVGTAPPCTSFLKEQSRTGKKFMKSSACTLQIHRKYDDIYNLKGYILISHDIGDSIVKIQVCIYWLLRLKRLNRRFANEC